MAITLKQLEAFHAVMSSGSVTRAAAMLGVSQPAISRILSDFESRAGFALFTRASRNLVPTARARALHSEVERAYLGLGHIEASMLALRDRGVGQLRLGVVPSLLPHVSAQLIAPFVQENPQLSISVEVVSTLNGLDWGSFRQTDLGITFEVISAAGTEVLPVGQTEAACVVPAGHWLAERGGTVQLQDLVGEVFVSYMPGNSFRIAVDRLFAEAGVARNLQFEARTSAAVCELVCALGGVSILPSPGQDLSADRRLVLLSLRPELVSEVVLVLPKFGPASPIATAFVTFARDRTLDFLADLPRGSSA
ncbi:LysR Transcriptional regulator [Rhabdaerophilaceae bacterium]